MADLENLNEGQRARQGFTCLFSEVCENPLYANGVNKISPKKLKNALALGLWFCIVYCMLTICTVKHSHLKKTVFTELNVAL